MDGERRASIMSTLDKMTPEQKRKYDDLENKIKQLAQKQKLLINRASEQERKDATRRAIVTGQLYFTKAANNKQARQDLENMLRDGVAANQRYLFPELWPSATRPTRKKKTEVKARETIEA